VDHVFAQLANGTPLELAARQPQMMRPQQIITRQPSAEGRDETDGNCKPGARGTLQSPDHADPDHDSTIQFFAVQCFSSWKAFAMSRLFA